MLAVEIDGRDARINFEAAHMIPENERCGHLHGHSYFINVRIKGNTESSILVDFTALKERLRELASALDHKMLIPSKDGRFKVEDNRVTADINGRKYLFPEGDCFLLNAEACTAERIAMYLHGELLKEFEEFNIAVGIEEGIGSIAWYEP
jgi:6-pyruvoyltetrahydropterin/6-carboxytetrahydropterin synthase